MSIQITMLGTNLKIYIFNNIKEHLWHFPKDVNLNREDEKEELIIMSLAIPFEHLKKMLENSIITEEDLKEAMGFGLSKSPIEEISEDKDTSSETDREDYGSKWTDWSPYVEDWLKDDEPEK